MKTESYKHNRPGILPGTFPVHGIGITDGFRHWPVQNDSGSESGQDSGSRLIRLQYQLEYAVHELYRARAFSNRQKIRSLHYVIAELQLKMRRLQLKKAKASS